MKIHLALTLRIDRERPPAEPEPDNRPVIYDMSKADIERAPQFDHDNRPPIGFQASAPEETP